MSNEKDSLNKFWIWIGRNIFRLLSFLIAGALIFSVIRPVTARLAEYTSKNIADLIPITKTHIETLAAPQQAGTNVISIEQITNLAVVNIEQIRTATSESSTPRVWVYGLQLAALVTVLGAAFWAIVALCRSEF